MPARRWLDLTTEHFRTRDMGRAIAVLPVAAVEQHGPHLPVGVDATIAEGYLARAAPLLPEDLDVLVLPVQASASRTSTWPFPACSPCRRRRSSAPGRRWARACIAPAAASS